MRPCKTCPFLIETKNFGRIDWIEEVFFLVRNGVVGHSCHVTDEKADGYIGGKKRACDGLKMLKDNENLGMHLHKNVFKSFKSCLSAHLQENLKEVEQLNKPKE